MLLAIFFDQMAKHAALSRLSGNRGSLIIKGIIQLTIVRNSGAAFGLLKGRQRLLKIVTMLLVLLIFIYMIRVTYSVESALPGISLAFIAGGAIGNLIDRLRFNHVVDFISLNIRRFPVFNLADIFVLTGSILYILCSFSEPTLF